ncbi:hypothetical protein MTO96_052078, partial [Rhipicephalus appendiculatus]
AEQYIFNRIINATWIFGSGVVNVAKAVRDTVSNTIKAVIPFSDAKGAVTTKASDILQKIIVKDLSLYALEDSRHYKDFRQDVAEDLSRAAESLIKKELNCALAAAAHT